MIDIEDQVYTKVARKLREEHPGVFVTGTYTQAPPDFPCVQIEETRNITNTKTEDSGSNENHAVLTYKIDVYSILSSGAKQECRKIMSTADDQFLGMGFTRTSMMPTPNVLDSQVYRITAMYEGVVSRDKVIYGR